MFYKNIRTIFTIILIFITSVFFGCLPGITIDDGNTGDSGDTGNTGDSGDTGDTGNSGDTGGTGESYETVTVTNGTNFEFAVFYNEVKHTNFIEKIDVFADHQFIGLPDINKFYVLRFIRYSDYEAATTNAELEEVKVLYSELVYSDTIETYNVTVQGCLQTGDSEVIWENTTDYWIEVRSEGISGQVLDVMPPHSVRKDYIPSRAYDIFPIFKIEIYQDAAQTIIIGLKDFADLDQVYTFQAISGETHHYTVTENSIPSQHVNGYILLNNQSDNGFRFRSGNTLQISDLGYEVTNSGSTVLYSLEGEAAPGREYTNLNVKTSNTNIGNNGEIQVPDINVIFGLMYEVIIHADYTITIEAGTPIDDVPDIALTYNYDDVFNGDILNLGETEQGQTQTFSFLITNEGSEVLSLTGSDVVTLSGDVDFSISQYPTDFDLEPGISTTFEVEFYASTVTDASTTVTIESNDMDENPFQFDLNVSVIPPLPEIEVYDFPDENLITNGGAYDMGDTTQSGTINSTFTIQNPSQTNLVLTEPKVIVETLDSSYFSVASYPLVIIPAGMSSNFIIEFNADDVISDRITNVRILCEDIDDYEFLLTASVTP